MKKTTVTELTGHPDDIVDDPLTEVLRSGAQRLLVLARHHPHHLAGDGALELGLGPGDRLRRVHRRTRGRAGGGDKARRREHRESSW